jgi:hypothetical protein
MDKTIVGLIGAISALATVDAAQAATPTSPKLDEVMTARTFGDLLEPIPNALALLHLGPAAPLLLPPSSSPSPPPSLRADVSVRPLNRASKTKPGLDRVEPRLLAFQGSFEYDSRGLSQE